MLGTMYLDVAYERLYESWDECFRTEVLDFYKDKAEKD
jgi:hypothetical protein